LKYVKVPKSLDPNKQPVLLSQYQSDGNQATHSIPKVCVAELASHNAATATQVMYSSSVA
jgi:hypothetical protein